MGGCRDLSERRTLVQVDAVASATGVTGSVVSCPGSGGRISGAGSALGPFSGLFSGLSSGDF